MSTNKTIDNYLKHRNLSDMEELKEVLAAVPWEIWAKLLDQDLPSKVWVELCQPAYTTKEWVEVCVKVGFRTYSICDLGDLSNNNKALAYLWPPYYEYCKKHLKNWEKALEKGSSLPERSFLDNEKYCRVSEVFNRYTHDSLISNFHLIPYILDRVNLEDFNDYQTLLIASMEVAVSFIARVVYSTIKHDREMLDKEEQAIYKKAMESKWNTRELNEIILFIKEDCGFQKDITLEDVESVISRLLLYGNSPARIRERVTRVVDEGMALCGPGLMNWVEYLDIKDKVKSELMREVNTNRLNEYSVYYRIKIQMSIYIHLFMDPDYKDNVVKKCKLSTEQIQYIEGFEPEYRKIINSKREDYRCSVNRYEPDWKGMRYKAHYEGFPNCYYGDTEEQALKKAKECFPEDKVEYLLDCFLAYTD